MWTPVGPLEVALAAGLCPVSVGGLRAGSRVLCPPPPPLPCRPNEWLRKIWSAQGIYMKSSRWHLQRHRANKNRNLPLLLRHWPGQSLDLECDYSRSIAYSIGLWPVNGSRPSPRPRVGLHLFFISKFPDFREFPENFHPCMRHHVGKSWGMAWGIMADYAWEWPEASWQIMPGNASRHHGGLCLGMPQGIMADYAWECLKASWQIMPGNASRHRGGLCLGMPQGIMSREWVKHKSGSNLTLKEYFKRQTWWVTPGMVGRLWKYRIVINYSPYPTSLP